MSIITDFAGEYFNLGLAIVPVASMSKKATVEWKNGSYKSYTSAQEAIDACTNLNIGIALGARSGNLIDIDFDSPIAEKIAYLFLPDTRTFGHGTRPISHRIYYTDESTAIQVYHDVGTKGRGNKGKKLIEWRANGCMTVFPGSIHESGEPIEWRNPDTEIATIKQETLKTRLGQLHAATLFAMRTEDGTRHDGAMAIGGWLARAGYEIEDAVLVVRAIAKARGKGGERDSVQAVKDSYRRYESGDTVYGKTMLDDMYGASVVRLATESLGISAAARNRRIQHTFTAIEGITDAGYDCNDTGNARRFCALYGCDVRYLVERDVWLVWSDEGWTISKKGEIQRLAVATIERIKAESAAAIGDRRHDLAEWAILSGNMYKRDAMLKAARSEPGMSISVEELDQRNSLLKVRNATIDLVTGIAYPHYRDDLLLKRVPITYAEHADCPIWLSFLEYFFPSATMRVYLHRAFGYTLTGYTKEQALFLLHGNGGNGKSTLLDVLRALLGEYAITSQMSTITSKHNVDRGHSDDLARFAGARVVTVSEASKNMRVDEGLVKQLTGGDEVTASFKGEKGFQFTPTHKLWIGLNDRPDIQDESHGMWRRIHEIPCTVQIPENQRVLGFSESLITDELPGILNWAIQGAVLYHSDGQLTIPEEVKEATLLFRQESDQTGRWLSECTVASATKTDKESGMSLYQSYVNWCRMNGEDAVTNIAWSRKMALKGYEKKINDKGTVWNGIRLNEMQQDIASAMVDNQVAM